jgi:hypothetical protein
VSTKTIEFPFRYVITHSLGTIFYPYVFINLKTIQGWREFRFIVDTGADLTILPRYMATLLGIDLGKCKKTSSQGIGGTIIQTWASSVTLDIKGYKTEVRCSITSESKTPLLLGRIDLLEKNMSWHFDSKRRKIVFELLQ